MSTDTPNTDTAALGDLEPTAAELTEVVGGTRGDPTSVAMTTPYKQPSVETTALLGGVMGASTPPSTADGMVDGGCVTPA